MRSERISPSAPSGISPSIAIAISAPCTIGLPNAVPAANSGSRCRGLRSPLASANRSMSSVASFSWRSTGMLNHQRLERSNALLLQQGRIGQAHVEAALELVYEPDLGERVPALDRRRSVVVCDLDPPAEDVFEHGLEVLMELLVGDHGSSVM